MDVNAGYFLKMRRAKEQYDFITGECREFIENKLDFTSTLELDGEYEWEILRWDGTPDTDPMWGVLVGEFIHNVRSALDQLMWAAVIANGHDPGEHTQFPIYDAERKWEQAIVDRDPTLKPAPTSGLSDEVFAIIDAAQPYHLRNKQRQGHPLYRLLRMSNIDKHRTLHVSAVSASSPELFRYEPPGFISIVKKRVPRPKTLVEDGAEIVRVKRRIIGAPPPGTDVYVHMRGAAEVVFGELGKPPIASVNDLGRIRNAALEVLVAVAPIIG